jgi:hypothetical protein
MRFVLSVHQVSWVEHVEVDDKSVHEIYKLLVNSGLGFGARRWVGTLDRQCERLASVMASSIPTSDIGGKSFLLRNAEPTPHAPSNGSKIKESLRSVCFSDYKQ